MKARHKAVAATPIDRRIVQTFVLFGTGAMLWLAGFGYAKAGLDGAPQARPAVEQLGTSGADLSKLIALHRHTTGLSVGRTMSWASPSPCCAAARKSK